MSAPCTTAVEPDPATDALPPASAVRRSRAGRWRAAVLIAVHVAIALHVAHWFAEGETLTPLEPSEAMEFSKRGVVNAGAIFFALAILSTALLGRWFCGWACHLVALQDGCRWVLVKLGIRPKPVHLGLLGLVPWILFVYMFLAPLLYRAIPGSVAGQQQPLGAVATQLTTDSFWATFPTWVMAVVTLLVCGFAIVYFLGAKGFCTYGCPYGAIFGITDQLAPLRIRVTDACNGCGHCTVVCTSNVRVHQEVRDWKAVVDPGCMKCLDCVSVCPTDALYVGWGRPAIATAPVRSPETKGTATRTTATKRNATKPTVTKPPVTTRTPAGRTPGGRVARVALAAAFTWASFTLLLWHGGELEPRFALGLAVGSIAVALVFAGKSVRAGAPSLGEELLLALVFLASLYAFRGVPMLPGLPDAVPLLLSVGLAAICAYCALLLARALRGANASLQGLELVRGRRPTRAGVAFAALALPLVLLWARSGWLQVDSDRALIAQRRDLAQRRSVLARATEAYRRGVERAQAGALEEAIAEFRAAVELAPDFVEARENLAGMLCAAGRFAEGIVQYREALRLRPDDVDTRVLLGRAHAEVGDLGAAEEEWHEALRRQPDHATAHAALALLCEQRGDVAGAEFHRAQAARAAPVPRD